MVQTKTTCDIVLKKYFMQLYLKQMGKVKISLNKYINLVWQVRMYFLNKIATHSKHTEVNKPNNCVLFCLSSIGLHDKAHMPCDDSNLQVCFSMQEFLWAASHNKISLPLEGASFMF